jgi:DNA polymerase I
VGRAHRDTARENPSTPWVPRSEPSEFLNSRASADYRALAGDASDNIPGVRGVGAKTAAALLDGGLTLDDLPASGRLAGQKGVAVTRAWQQVLTWRDMIRMNSRVPVPGEAITGLATTPLPRPAEVIEKLGLWKRVPPAELNGTLW